MYTVDINNDASNRTCSIICIVPWWTDNLRIWPMTSRHSRHSVDVY